MITIAPESPKQLDLFSQPVAAKDDGSVVDWDSLVGEGFKVVAPDKLSGSLVAFNILIGFTWYRAVPVGDAKRRHFDIYEYAEPLAVCDPGRMTLVAIYEVPAYWPHLRIAEELKAGLPPRWTKAKGVIE